MRSVAALVVAAFALPASAQFVPQSWTRMSIADVETQDFTWDGGMTAASDSFAHLYDPIGSWSTDNTATAVHGSIVNSTQIVQSSNISGYSLTSSGRMVLQHTRPPSLSYASAYGHMEYWVSVTLAAPTLVSIDFNMTSSIGSTGYVNDHQCLFSVNSSTPFNALAGDWPGPALPSSYSFLGVLDAGIYQFSMDVLVSESAQGNERRALSWEYDWNMDVHIVPAPANAAVMGMALLAASRRRR